MRRANSILAMLAMGAGVAWAQAPTATITGMPQPLPLEHTQLAQTKTKPTSLASLAGDSVLAQAMQVETNAAVQQAAAHVNSNLGSTSMQEAGNVVTGLWARRKPAVTYVWGVPGPTAATEAPSATPEIDVDYSAAPGANPDEYAPELVKLTPAQNTCRLVGATSGKQGADTSSDWQVYSNFVEDRVAVAATRLGKGKYHLKPEGALLPGEYGVVLRPIDHGKKFQGGDVARDQGDGMMFDTVWTFRVSMKP